jgi:O-acetylhomoserine/O-acetylserine sulfhydrylase
VSAPLTTSNTFVFRNVSVGSYLADIHCPTFAFAPLRVDVSEAPGSEGKDNDVVSVWETYRGNDWDNKGEAVASDAVGYELRVLGVKSYFMERSKCEAFPYFPCLKISVSSPLPLEYENPTKVHC